MAGMTNRRVLRSLDHMWQGTNNKFVNKLRPTYAMPTPTYVPPKDRIAFWNIVPGDVVRVRSGAVAHDEHGQKIRGEGIVQSIDRTTNRVYLRDLDVRRSTDARTTISSRPRISSTLCHASSIPRQAKKKATRAMSLLCRALCTTRSLCSRCRTPSTTPHALCAPSPISTAKKACLCGSDSLLSK